MSGVDYAVLALFAAVAAYVFVGVLIGHREWQARRARWGL